MHRAHRRIPDQPEADAPAAGPHVSELVAIGVSTGGPSVLRSILSAVDAPLGVPILVTQHNARGFNRSLAAWLGETTGHDVVLCGEHMRLEPGRVYLSCDERHLRLVARDAVAAVDGPRRNYVRPSADELFDSVALYAGARATAVLLSGMGCDGAAGLLRLRERGARTIVQAPDSCAAAGMPRAALALGAADAVLAPAQIAEALVRIAPANSLPPARRSAA